MYSNYPPFSSSLASDPTTRRLWYSIATVHDFESHDGMSESRLYQKIFQAHCWQFSVIFLWVASLLLHVGWQGNFETWLTTPQTTNPIAHAVFDPHWSATTMGSYNGSIRSFSGLYNLWATIGFTSNQQLSMASIGALTASVLFVGLSFKANTLKMSQLANFESRFNHHLSVFLGMGSILWSGHLIHVAIPNSRGAMVNWNNFSSLKPHPAGLEPFLSGQWATYATNPDSSGHLFGQLSGAGTSILSFHGILNPQTNSLYLTDIAHHHLAIGVIFVILGHFFKTNFGIGHVISKTGWVGVYQNSLHCQLGFALAFFGVTASVVAQHMYLFQPYVYLSNDLATTVALYTHHQYIAAFLMCGAFAHGAIFYIRDYDPTIRTWFSTLLKNKESIISHLSWVSLFLGFHTLGLYVHNDVMCAFGMPEKQILIEPVFAQWFQSLGLFGLDGAWENIGPGDFLVHHAIALGLHTTTLVLMKGALDARGSRLMPDKKDFGYSFPCDGPGRGGTCDISAFDAFYLALFWALNTIGWTTFYFHWKHMSPAAFEGSSTYLMGWFRDYLWLHSSQLINGYTPFGMNSLSVWAWVFLAAHLCWATGFMFLISWRGYWQEVVEVLTWAHENTPIANNFVWRDKPVALSIVQARVVGLAHFAVGYVFTYGAFVIGSSV